MKRALIRAALPGLLAVCLVAAAAHPSAQDAVDRPVLVVDTTKGSFAFETYPNDAPLTVAHILELVRAHFYDGQRVHRALPGFVVQFGDPQTRDLAKRELWGRGAAAASGNSIGVAEVSKKRLHKMGAVGMAHTGNPAKADSQIYIALAPRHDLDGRYVVFGQIVSGEEVPGQLQVGDEIRRIYLRQ